MIEFFSSIVTWIKANGTNILLFFTSANFISFITAIVLLMRQVKSNKANKSVIDNMSNNVAELRSLHADLSKLHDTVQTSITSQNTTNSKLSEVFTKLDELLSICTQKLNGILEVQSIVYNSIGDDIDRKNIFNIITAAKSDTGRTIEELQSTVEKLKEVISTKVEDAVATAEKASEAVATIAPQVPSRY